MSDELSPPTPAPADGYEPPSIDDLGSLADMTLGSAGNASDAMGGASGSGGSI